jgi:PPOX class probable F420-dependent enzyme
MIFLESTAGELLAMRMEPAEAQDRFGRSPVLRLATAGADGRPHVVPCTFAIDGSGRIVIGVDNKPKISTNLRRLRNVGENPRVSLLVDHYADDWTELWWVRADGSAVVEVAGAGHASGWALLRAKYSQYEGQVLDGPVIVVAVERWSGWSFT